MALSFSKLRLFEDCELAFLFRYVLKKPEGKVETKYADFGSCVHETIEEFQKSQGFLPHIFRQKWSKFELDGRMDYNLGYKCVETGIKREYTFTDVEQRVQLKEPIAFNGIIDLIDHNKKIIVDWKTSSYDIKKIDEYKRQLLCYAWLTYRLFGWIPNKCILDFVKADKVFEWSFKKEELLEWEEYVINLQKKIDDFIKIATPKNARTDVTKCFFCPHKHICREHQNGLNLRFIIRGGSFKIEGYVPPMVEKVLLKELSYEKQNAFWIRKASGYSGVVNFYDRRNRTISLGFLDRTKELCYAYGRYKNQLVWIEEVNLHEDIDDIEMPDSLNDITLRDYQEEAVEAALKQQRGFIQVPTGGGKTSIAAEMIRRIRKPTLFIVDRKELLTQAVETFQTLLGVEVGVIGGSQSILTESCPPTEVVVATIQSLHAKRKDKILIEYLSKIGCVIVDEAHKSAATSYVGVFRLITNAEYRFGITATVKRDDGEEMQFTSIIGPIIYDIKSQTLIEKGYLMYPDIYFLPYRNNRNDEAAKVIVKDGERIKVSYPDYYNEHIVNHKDRNDMIKQVVDEHVEKGHKILVLTKQIEHLEILNGLLKGSKVIHGGSDKKEREKVFDEFRKGDCNVLVGTLSIFSEGINVPALNVVVNAAANAGEVKTVQLLGRVMRTMVNKKDALYIDFIDETLFGWQHTKKRRNILRSLGYQVNQWKLEKENEDEKTNNNR